MTKNLTRLLDIMARLRDPEHGCPWDLAQNFATIVPYTIEEAYEVADAIDRSDMAALMDELGDLLLQVVFHAQMAREAGNFDFDDVAGAIAAKMLRRHPHVFGDESADPKTLRRRWEEHKAEERAAAAGDRATGDRASALDGVSKSLPALARAEKLQRRAANVGFDWPRAAQVLDKIEEEIGEVRAEIDHSDNAGRIGEEIGDLLFACANLARHFDIDAEEALRKASNKFSRRFNYIEDCLATQNRLPQDADLDELESLWGQAKQQENSKKAR